MKKRFLKTECDIEFFKLANMKPLFTKCLSCSMIRNKKMYLAVLHKKFLYFFCRPTTIQCDDTVLCRMVTCEDRYEAKRVLFRLEFQDFRRIFLNKHNYVTLKY